jgi:hypothetical protein
MRVSPRRRWRFVAHADGAGTSVIQQSHPTMLCAISRCQQNKCNHDARTSWYRFNPFDTQVHYAAQAQQIRHHFFHYLAVATFTTGSCPPLSTLPAAIAGSTVLTEDASATLTTSPMYSTEACWLVQVPAVTTCRHCVPPLRPRPPQHLHVTTASTATATAALDLPALLHERCAAAIQTRCAPATPTI